MKLSGVVMTFGRSKTFPLCDNLLSLSSNLLKEHESQNVPVFCIEILYSGSWLGRPGDQLCDLFETIIRHYSQRTNFVNYLRQLSGIILLCPLHGLQMAALSGSLHTPAAKFTLDIYFTNVQL